MPLVATDWNVIVIGRWNRALLTPNYIIKDLFQHPKGTQVQVEFPMDAVGPFRLRHDGLVVMVTGPQLIVELQSNDYDSLDYAKRIAVRAAEELAKTPLTVAGYNIRFHSEQEDPALQPLLEATELWGRDRLARSGYEVNRQSVAWVADWDGGKITVTLVRANSDKNLEVNFNFERVGEGREELIDWLRRPTTEAKAHVERICVDVLGLPQEARA